MNDFCVIGSGPSAVSAAVALTRRGMRVTMLDAGHTLEPERRETVIRMSQQQPDQWSPDDIRRIKEGVRATPNGIPLKRLYGSTFAFEDSGTGYSGTGINSGLHPSFANGGLSNVWGAGMLRFYPDDIADWPIAAHELDAGYAGVLSFVGELRTMPQSRQGAALLRDAERSREALGRSGITVEPSSLAVDGRACRQCGMCLYGCPYELIYNSAFTLRDLKDLPNFRYEPGFVVERLSENHGAVRIAGHDLQTQQPREFEAARVMLGVGVIPSTAILLGSLGDLQTPIRLQDSFYFLLPMLRFAAVPGLNRERLHTLAQAFILMRDPEVTDSFVHFSLYGYNDLMVPSLEATAGLAGSLLASRAMVCGGYLHSRLSPGISMTVNPGPAGKGYSIRLEGENADAAEAIARRAAAKLAKQALRLRSLALPFAMRFSPPGRGFHSGGSFPMTGEMTSQRTRHTSDIEGRPHGFDRVHLIDSSCLPSIPATTITLPVMANAWRIANLAADRGIS